MFFAQLTNCLSCNAFIEPVVTILLFYNLEAKVKVLAVIM